MLTHYKFKSIARDPNNFQNSSRNLIITIYTAVIASMVFISEYHGKFYCRRLIIDTFLEYAGKDIEGSKKIIVALSKVKGLGYNFSQVLLQSLNINPSMRVGFLTEKEIEEIENLIKNPSQSQMPTWYMNRRKDLETGFDRHLITSDLDFTISNDIEREKTVYSWRGYRHMFGLKVRGQCTEDGRQKGRSRRSEKDHC